MEPADVIQASLDVNLLAGGGVARVSHELLELRNTHLGASRILGLLGVEAFGVPVGGQHGLASEHLTQLRIVKGPTLFAGAGRHDLEQGPNRRHGKRDRPISEVSLRHPGVSHRDRPHRIGEDLGVL